MSESVEKSEHIVETSGGQRPKETASETEEEVKSVLFKSINDVVASVDEFDDNKSEYESVVDENDNREESVTTADNDNSAHCKHIDGENNCLPPIAAEAASVELDKNHNECEDKQPKHSSSSYSSSIDDKHLRHNYTKEELFGDIDEKDADDTGDVFFGEEGGEEAYAEINEDDEYEDIDSDMSDEGNEEEAAHVHQETAASNEAKKENEDDDDHCVEGERERGDGQESGEQSANHTDKELDDDEDRRNPQYIPKRGAFYEHDDRITGEEGEKTNEPAVVIAKKAESAEKSLKKTKKLWADDGKWKHDLFNEEEQKPKSYEEVFQTYGYDIRNEDAPPKARRRRRYGRGPNKYTRNWKDEGAYSKMKMKEKVERKGSHSGSEKEVDRGEEPKRYLRRPRAQRVPFKNEDFPELPVNEREKNKQDKSRVKNDSGAWNKAKSPNVEKEYRRPVSPDVEYKTEPMKVIDAIENNRRSSVPTEASKVDMVRTQTFENSRYSNRRGDESTVNKNKPKVKLNVIENNHAEMGRAIRKTSHLQDSPRNIGYNTQKTEQSDKTRKNNGKVKDDICHEDGRGDVRSNHNNAKYMSEVSSGMQKMSLEKTRTNESEPVQPRPKRYSSLRQQQQHRTVPEALSSQMPTNAQNLGMNHQQRQAPQSQFYDAAPHSPGFYPETASSRSSFAFMSQSNTDNQPQPNQHPSRFISHQMSPRYLPPNAGETSSETQFIPQAVPQQSTPQTTPAHPPVIPTPAASFLPAYPPGYPQFPPPPPPQFHPMPAPPPSQAEIYRGGVTYYDTTAQQGPRQLPQRRPKNAIPIVPPPADM
ncbi:protein CASC3-like protein [Dinothrombium tinctorium]|uniref:Protein CASC3 n=1 Tax=Dinothrombium tinctorium TaxID=1965070 RepID=A0A443RBQ5_9ACAR|nr:protein CASC3-like protein [Dinothrombium tinctorium]